MDSAKKGDTYTVSTMIRNAGESFEKELIQYVLYCAVKEGNIEATDLLLSSGADVNGYSIRASYISLSTDGEMKIHTFQREHPLATAVRMQHSAIVRLILAKGGHIDAQTQYCNNINGYGTEHPDGSAMHIAIAKHNVTIVNILLRQGARLDIKDRFQKNAFHVLAEEWAHVEDNLVRLSKILRMMWHSSTAACALNAKDCRHYTPMHISAYYNNCVLATHFIDNGAILDGYSFSIDTALSMCIRYGHSVLAGKLIVHGAYVNVSDCSFSSFIALTIQRVRLHCTNLCQLLVFTGCHFKERFQRPYDKRQNKKEQLCDWLRTVQCTPHRLDDSCRICIRTFLCEKVVNGTSIVPTILKLNLPYILIDYLLMRDITEIPSGSICFY